MKYIALVVLIFIAMLSYNFADYFNVQKDLRMNVQTLDIARSKTRLDVTGNWVDGRDAYKQEEFQIKTVHLSCDLLKQDCREEIVPVGISGLTMQAGEKLVAEYKLVKNTAHHLVLKSVDGELQKISITARRNPFSRYVIINEKTGAMLVGRQQLRWMVAKRAMRHGALGWVIETLGMHRELEKQP